MNLKKKSSYNYYNIFLKKHFVRTNRGENYTTTDREFRNAELRVTIVREISLKFPRTEIQRLINKNRAVECVSARNCILYNFVEIHRPFSNRVQQFSTFFDYVKINRKLDNQFLQLERVLAINFLKILFSFMQ